MSDVHYDSGDQASVDNQAKETARQAAEDHETVRKWMSHEKGRDFLFRLVWSVCHLGEMFAATDEHGRSDTHRTYLHLGERNIGAWLDERMRLHPTLYAQMHAEQQIKAEARNQRLLKQNAKRDDDGGSDDSD